MEAERTLSSGALLRLLRTEDAAPLAEAYSLNRAHLAPWEPERAEEHFTEEGQKHATARSLAELVRGTELPLVLDDEGTIIGRATLTSIVRGAFQNAHLGYWIARPQEGRGIMTEAVGAVLEIARDGLGLHGIEAAALPHNLPSQRVLAKNGFEPYGIAKAYMRIAGQWQDHRMYQRILKPR